MTSLALVEVAVALFLAPFHQILLDFYLVFHRACSGPLTTLPSFAAAQIRCSSQYLVLSTRFSCLDFYLVFHRTCSGPLTTLPSFAAAQIRCSCQYLVFLERNAVSSVLYLVIFLWRKKRTTYHWTTSSLDLSGWRSA